MRNNAKIGLFCWFAVLISTFLCALYFSMQEPPRSKVTKKLRTQLNASCVIKTKAEATGSGVTLDTGYVLTAAHVVDDNNNNKIDKDEREVSLAYYGDVSEVTSGTVVYYNAKDDIAFIKPDKTFSIGAKASRLPGLLGERVVTIGATRTAPPMISAGLISEDDGKRHRVSCYVSIGNSGGGIFKSSDGEVVGIINTMKTITSRSCVVFMVPDGTSYRIIHTHVPVRHELNGVAGYVPIDVIRNDLIAKNLMVLLENPPEPDFWNHMRIAIAKSILQAFLVLFTALAIRRYVFNSRLS